MNDAISRSAVVKAILAERDKIPIEIVERYGFGTKTPYNHGQSMRGGIRKALRCIEQAPAIDAVPVVHAGWKDQDYTFTRFQCTACKSMNHSIMTKYCPDCGARMDSEGKEEK